MSKYYKYNTNSPNLTAKTIFYFCVFNIICFNNVIFLQDFDLCINCYEKSGHPHRMEKLGLDLDDGSSPADQKQANPQVNQSNCKWQHVESTHFEHLNCVGVFAKFL
jgi:hypothetical protein